jgi:hypothetical protein
MVVIGMAGDKQRLEIQANNTNRPEGQPEHLADGHNGDRLGLSLQLQQLQMSPVDRAGPSGLLRGEKRNRT